jgi:hypothetical protein
MKIRTIFVGLSQADENKATLNPAVARFESDFPNLAARRSPAARRPSSRRPSPCPLLTAARRIPAVLRPSPRPLLTAAHSSPRARSSPPPAPHRRPHARHPPPLTAARTPAPHRRLQPAVRGAASNLPRPSNSNPPRLRTRAVDVLPPALVWSPCD